MSSTTSNDNDSNTAQGLAQYYTLLTPEILSNMIASLPYDDENSRLNIKDEIARLERKVTELENQIKHNGDDAAALKNTIACLRDEIDTLEDSCYGLTGTNACLAADLADKKEIVNTNDDLFDENALLRDENDFLKDENARLLIELEKEKENAKKPAGDSNRRLRRAVNYKEQSLSVKLRRL